MLSNSIFIRSICWRFTSPQAWCLQNMISHNLTYRSVDAVDSLDVSCHHVNTSLFRPAHLLIEQMIRLEIQHTRVLLLVVVVSRGSAVFLVWRHVPCMTRLVDCQYPLWKWLLSGRLSNLLWRWEWLWCSGSSWSHLSRVFRWRWWEWQGCWRWPWWWTRPGWLTSSELYITAGNSGLSELKYLKHRNM